MFHNVEDFEKYIDSDSFDRGPDGKIILQQYIKPAGNVITRVELVGDRFVLAMHSSTEDGFELCPSDVCQLEAMAEKQAGPDVCPIDGGAKFSPADLSEFDPLVQKYLRMMEEEGIDIAGIEYVEDEYGTRYTYDINGTTNYNNKLGDQIGIHGMTEVAKYIKKEVLQNSGENHYEIMRSCG